MNLEDMIPKNRGFALQNRQNGINDEVKNAKEIISSSKTFYIITDEKPEAQACALALFYTLKDREKTANLLLKGLPKNLSFLSPSLDFISYPKNFVISIPKRTAEVSQIYYEKNDNEVKIHLTIEKGQLKKEDVSFYFSETKSDAIITVGVKDYRKKLTNDLNSFGFLLESPVINIDNGEENLKFGKANIVEEKPMAKQVLRLSESVSLPAAKCLLTSLVLRTKNFTENVTPEVFEMAATLSKQGADIQEINKYLNS